MPSSSYTILGIDPGTNLLGYAVISVRGQQIHLINMSVIDLRKNEIDQKLGIVLIEIEKIIHKYKPEHLAIEAPFFSKNAQSMLKLGRVQGIAIGLALSNNIKVQEYAPLRIKQMATGRGNATKQEVSRMMQHIFSIQDETRMFFDDSDALAVAFCHFQHLSTPNVPLSTIQSTLPKKSSGTNKRKLWADFVKNQS